MAYKMRPDSPVMNLQDEFSWGWGVPNWQDQWDGVTVPSEVHPVPPCQPSEYEGLKNNNKPSSNQYSSQAQRCLQRLGSLMNDSTFADLTLRCRSETFAVHRAVICPQSKFFEKSICGAFKEARTAEITLEEDADTIRRMISFLYTSDYDNEAEADLSSSSPESEFEGSDIESSAEESNTEFSTCSSNTAADRLQEQVLTHIAVHACADKYDIQPLAELALSRFDAIVQGVWPHKDFISIVLAISKSSRENSAIRNTIFLLCAEHYGELREDPRWGELIAHNDDCPELGFELFCEVQDRHERLLELKERAARVMMATAMQKGYQDGHGPSEPPRPCRSRRRRYH